MLTFKLVCRVFAESGRHQSAPDRKLRFFATKIQKQETVAVPAFQKRTNRQKKLKPELQKQTSSNQYAVKAFATAAFYNLDRLTEKLANDAQFRLKSHEKLSHVCCAEIRDGETKTAHECLSEALFFREGCAVFWNCSEPQIDRFLQVLAPFQEQSYRLPLVIDESEELNFQYSSDCKNTVLKHYTGEILLSAHGNDLLDKYTFSNALALSVKLGIWESMLDRFIDTLEPITEDLKSGVTIKLTRNEVLKKQGELFSLRHAVNLRSDLIDTPSFYWEEEQLEKLYLQTCQYLSIPKRTYVLNQRVNYCLELVELLSSHLNDKHHVRLEWMIIVLIMLEAIFAFAHYFETTTHRNT